MKIHFLGTNGWYTSPTGNTPCILIDSKDHYVIFDAGNGIYQIDQYIKEDKPISLFISHFHIDHVSGLHTLSKFSFKQGMDIYIAKSRKKDFDLLVNPPYTVGVADNASNVSNLKTKVSVYELSDGDNDVGFPVRISELYHAFGDHGFRISLQGKTIAYSGDTKSGPNNLLIAKNADVLIHECSNVVSPEPDPWGHSDPVQAAQFARDAGVKKLILTHFAAHLYDTLEKRKIAEVKARKIFPNTLAATDGLMVEI